MNHRRLVFVDPHARLQQILVPVATGIPRRLHVRLRADGQHADVAPSPNRAFEEPAEVVVGHEIRIGDVQSSVSRGDTQGQKSFSGRAPRRGRGKYQAGTYSLGEWLEAV